MRIRGRIELVLMVIACCIAACATEPGWEAPSSEAPEAAPLTTEALQTSEVGVLQTCIADCLFPYDGNPVSCSSSGSCLATPSYVTCNGRTTSCRMPPPTTCQNPTWTCSSTAACEDQCGGPGMGICSNACCYCY